MARDLAGFAAQWNDRLVPLVARLPQGLVDADLNAFSNGLDGRTLYTDSRSTGSLNATYYNLIKGRPNSVYEQFALIYADLTSLREFVDSTIGNFSVSASQVSIEDRSGLYDAGDVEEALAEVMVMVNALDVGLGAGYLPLTGGSMQGAINMNGYGLLAVSGVSMTTSGLVDGRDVSVDGNNLDVHIADTGLHTGTVSGLSDTTIVTPVSGQALTWTGAGWENATPSTVTTLSGLTDTTIVGPVSGNTIQHNGSTWINIDALIGTPTAGDYTSGFTPTFTPETTVADAVQTLNEVDYTLAALVATPPGNLTGNNLSLAGTTQRSAKLPTGLPGGWGSYTPGNTITNLIFDNTYTLTSPNTSTRFNVGLDSNPTGTVTHVEDAGDADARTIAAGTGTTGKLNVNSIATYNTVWKKANAIISDTQADGERSHALKHTTAGQTNTFTMLYDSLATAPSFDTGIAWAQLSSVDKYLSGILYYGQNSTFIVTAEAASGIFEQAYHSTRVANIGVAGGNTVNLNPAGTPAVGDTFVISGTVTVNGNTVQTSPTTSVNIYKPADTQNAGETSGLDREICKSDSSTSTLDNFDDENQRLQLGTATPWVASGVLVDTNLQVDNSTLRHGNDGDYAGFSGDQSYERMIAKVAGAGGTLTHTGLTVTALGGNYNIYLQLETDSKWFDIGLDLGLANGTGSGDSLANSIGAKISGGSNSTVFSFAGTGYGGPYNSGNNNDEYRVRVVYTTTGGSMTVLQGA